MTTPPVNQYRPDYVVSPGEMLAFELEIRQMTKQELDKQTGLSFGHTRDILGARTAITLEIATELERVIGMPMQFWINLQTQYDANLRPKASGR